jgi:hypothetical protein
MWCAAIIRIAYLTILLIKLPGLIWHTRITVRKLFALTRARHYLLAQKPMPIAPSWVAVHGDHGRISQVARSDGSKTGFTAWKKCGVWSYPPARHIAAHTEASGGIIGRILTGMEVGKQHAI